MSYQFSGFSYMPDGGLEGVTTTDAEREPFAPIHHSQTTISQLSTQAVCSSLNLAPEDMAGEIIVDLGSGLRQQFARDMEQEFGAVVISIDPNLPHTDEFKLHKLENDVRGRMISAERNGTAISAELEELIFRQELMDFIAAKGFDPIRLSEGNVQKLAVEYVEEIEDWPKKAYGKSVAAVDQHLPLADRSVDRVIATTSVPFGLAKEQIPGMLVEACRVLKGKGKTAHFWPMVAETDIYQEIKLAEIRELVKRARREAATKAEREALTGFGLSVSESGLIKESFRRISDHLSADIMHQSRSLVLTRKIA